MSPCKGGVFRVKVVLRDSFLKFSNTFGLQVAETPCQNPNIDLIESYLGVFYIMVRKLSKSIPQSSKEEALREARRTGPTWIHIF